MAVAQRLGPGLSRLGPMNSVSDLEFLLNITRIVNTGGRCRPSSHYRLDFVLAPLSSVSFLANGILCGSASM